MIELHTKIVCHKCGKTYHAMHVSSLPLSQDIKESTFCPFCGSRNDYSYHFEADFSHRKKWQFWKKHFIANHFSANEGTFDTEIFPRKCACGKEILLRQTRKE